MSKSFVGHINIGDFSMRCVIEDDGPVGPDKRSHFRYWVARNDLFEKLTQYGAITHPSGKYLARMERVDDVPVHVFKQYAEISEGLPKGFCQGTTSFVAELFVPAFIKYSGVLDIEAEALVAAMAREKTRLITEVQGAASSSEASTVPNLTEKLAHLEEEIRKLKSRIKAAEQIAANALEKAEKHAFAVRDEIRNLGDRITSNPRDAAEHVKRAASSLYARAKAMEREL